MDFIDFDSFRQNGQSDQGSDSNLPQPQPALSLPISSNIENLGKRFSNLNSLTRNLLSLDDVSPSDKIENSVDSKELGQENELARKYAQLSISLLNKEPSNNESEGNEGSTHQASAIDESKIAIPSATSLSGRLSRVLNNHLSDNLTREIFTTLQDKFPDNSTIVELLEPGSIGSLSRKRLRGRIEGELIKNQTAVLKEYQPTISQLKSLSDSLNKLNEVNKSINSKVDQNFADSSNFNSRIKALNHEKKLITLKKNLLIGFKEKFTLNEYEQFVLSSGDINDEFFEVLAKAEQINENCSILLAIDNPQLGLKIMSKINQLINKSVDRIIAFSNKTLANLYSLNSKSKLTTLHQCLRYLRNKMNYFNSIISTFVESRSKTLLDEFLNEISTKSGDPSSSKTQHSQEGSSRPIFISEHDPIRYIGDLLAYVHSIVVNETDLITSIFTIEDLQSKEKSEFEQIITQIKDEVLKAIARPLRSKIDQIISSETKLSTIYSIYNLVELYSLMMSKQLNQSNEVLKTIGHLISLSKEKILGIIKSRLLTIQNSNSAKLELNLDLQPPEWIIDYFSDLLPIIDQMATSSSGTDSILDFSDEETKNFLNLIIDQPIDIFNEHVQSNKLFNLKQDQLILQQNFLDLILSKIIPISFLGEKVLELNEKINELTKELTHMHLVNLLKGCKLYDHYNVINMIYPFDNEDFDAAFYEPIKENKLFNTEEMESINERIQEFLPNALLDIQKSLLKLNSPMVVNDIVNDSSEEFANFFEKFGAVVREFLEIDFVWSAHEVRVLLGVEKKPSNNEELPNELSY